MVREMEKVMGVPVVQIATIVPIMMTVGTNRIVPGVAIPHPVGDPGAGPEKDRKKKRGRPILIQKQRSFYTNPCRNIRKKAASGSLRIRPRYSAFAD